MSPVEERNGAFGKAALRASPLQLVVGLLLFLVAAGRLGYEYYRLLSGQSPFGVVDFETFYYWTNNWFAGPGEASTLGSQFLLPASYVLLWPITGWLTIDNARFVWALAITLCLVLFVVLLTKEIPSASKPNRILFGLFLLAIYPTAITIGNGQLTFFALLPMLAAILLFNGTEPSRRRAAVIIPLLVISLIKPQLTIPFFWVILWHFRGWREVGITLVFYLLLTAAALSFQSWGLLLDWIFAAGSLAEVAGYGNIHMILTSLGLEQWNFAASLLLLLLLGAWTYYNRDANLWLLVGVAALTARFWTYHRLYDDLLIVFAIVALLFAQREIEQRFWATVVLFITLALALGLLVPGTILFLDSTISAIARAVQTSIWFIALCALAAATHFQHQHQRESSPVPEP